MASGVSRHRRPRERCSQMGEGIWRGSEAGVSRTRSDEARAAGGSTGSGGEVAKLRAERDILKGRSLLREGVDMKFGFIAKHIVPVWPVAWLCEALGVSRSGFHAWLKRGPLRARSREDEGIMPAVRARRLRSWKYARTLSARVGSAGATCWKQAFRAACTRSNVWMRAQTLRARPRRRASCQRDGGERSASAISPNVLDRQFTAGPAQPQMDCRTSTAYASGRPRAGSTSPR